jgi:hypothetical protein
MMSLSPVRPFRPFRPSVAETQASRSLLRLTGFPIGAVDTSAPISSCGYLGRLRLGQAVLLRLEGVGLLRVGEVTPVVSGGIATMRRLSLYDYAVVGTERGEGVPSAQVVFLDGSRAWVPFAAHVPFGDPLNCGLTGFAPVGLIRVEGD